MSSATIVSKPTLWRSSKPVRHFVAISLIAGLLAATTSCSEPATSELRAFRVTDRTQLFGGGPRALGSVGDYMLVNDKIRVVIQNAGFSRGFGVYGGSIIDADIRRPDEQGRNESSALGGHDIFAEMFSSFFFQAVACNDVKVLSDGSKAYDETYGTTAIHYDAGTAVIRASGGGGEFFTLLRVFNSIFLNYVVPSDMVTADGKNEFGRLGYLLVLAFKSFVTDVANLVNVNARYEIDYLLKPGSRHVEMRARMINQTMSPLPIPSAVLKNKLFQAQVGGIDLSEQRVPIGTVMLYGKLNDVWVPGVGFDLRHPMDRSFRRALPLPAFSGIVAEFIASSSDRVADRVSYGLIGAPSQANFVNLNADIYRNGGKFKDTWSPIDNTSLLVPFTASSFIGIFSDSMKGTILPGEFVEQVQEFIVGGGDVASIVDEVVAVRGMPSGNYDGVMRDSISGEPIADGQIVIYQELALGAATFPTDDDYLDAGLRLCKTAFPDNLCRPYSQDYPDISGNLTGTLPAGKYAYRVQGSGRALGPFVPFEIKAGQRTSIDPKLDRPSWLQALVVDEGGRPLPAKVSVVGQYPTPFTNAQRRSGGVFDVQAGETYRFSDMLDDSKDGQRGYLEATGYTDANGQVLISLRPGDYTVYFSRGFEYDLTSVPVHIEKGNATTVSGKVTRVVDTTGWMSMDGHVHGEDSIDSGMATGVRLKSVAGEGVEIGISTNHNFVSDWRPHVELLGLTPWMTSFVGIEFTTLESGHFNSYPLNYDAGPVTHGAFEWFGHPPADLFAGLRALAPDGKGNNIIVCNHPRDAILGYFSQYGRSSLTGGMLSQGASKKLAGPNGPAFFDGNGDSTLSYDCDALEIVNGKLVHEIRSIRVPSNWPMACYQPLPAKFDPKTQIDPCNINGKVLRPASIVTALVPGKILVDLSPSAPPGKSGIDNLEAVFPGAVDDWFHMLNQGYRHTGLATSDSHASVGEEPGAPRTYLYFGKDQPAGLDGNDLVDIIKKKHAATLSHGPFLTFTVAPGDGAAGGSPIGSEIAASTGPVTVNYKMEAPSWVSVNRIQVYLNGRMMKTIAVDPARDLSDKAGPPNGPFTGQLTLNIDKDSWIVLEAVGDKPMFPVITGTEEPFLLISDAIGALAGPLGIGATTDIGAVVVGNVQPYALTNPIWIRVSGDTWQPPGVVPYDELNMPDQDPHVGVLGTRN